MFNNLTGHYVTVSNYPGTTVEVTRGRGLIDGRQFSIVDTPGLYSLTPITEEERVARRILLNEAPECIVHMVDAKNLERMLPSTLQLIELDKPLILNLNIIDEAEKLGIHIDQQGLAEELGVPVVATVATSGRGVDKLRKEIVAARSRIDTPPLRYDDFIEDAIENIIRRLKGIYDASARGIALLLLQEDRETVEKVGARGTEPLEEIMSIVNEVKGRTPHSIGYLIANRRKGWAEEVTGRYVSSPSRLKISFAEKLSRLTIAPATGIPILLLVLYFGLYKFVGVFGAGTVVDFLEGKVFGEYFNPWVDGLLLRIFPASLGWQYWARELVGGQYGIFTLGVTYAVAIILPIVGLFFLLFSVLEDCGYFPRLALLIDRIFKRIGLNGRAVIPMVLGFGCVTMATMVTRILETRRERIIATLLLALAIPCSAQYGVITGLLAQRQAGFLGISFAFLLWAGIITGIFLVVGMLAAKVLGGSGPSFYMELPPLRLPQIGNVLTKTLTRMNWYFKEVLPLFMWASILIWVGRISRAFDLIIWAFSPLMGILGLPARTGEIFLYGFFRRDFGAAGLFDYQSRGVLSGVQLFVACVTLTLFLPCVAQLLIMKKERGLKVTAVMLGFIFATAFSVGALVNFVLTGLGVKL
jgi:ferrous iron transport protein B